MSALFHISKKDPAQLRLYSQLEKQNIFLKSICKGISFVMAEFDRQSPLFEKGRIPFEVLYLGTSSTSLSNALVNIQAEKKHAYYTLRILQGRRPIPSQQHGGTERAIRLEISDECSHFVSKSQNENTHSNKNIANLNLMSSIPLPRHTHTQPRQQSQPPSQNYPSPNSGMKPPIMMQQQPTNSLKDQHHPPVIVSGPVNLYELEVGETDFCELRRDLALLVDFPDFATSFISLLQFCDLGDIEDNNVIDEQNNSNEESGTPALDAYHDNSYHQCNGVVLPQTYRTPSKSINHQQNQQLSRYSCRLEILPSSTSLPSRVSNSPYHHKSNQASKSNTCRFSIVESNQFRELAHLSLNLQSGTDSSIRSYLSARLTQTMNHNATLQMRLRDQTNCATAAEHSSKIANEKLNKIIMSSETEKRELKLELGERMQQDLKTWEDKYKALENEKENDKKVMIQQYEHKLNCIQEKLEKVDADKEQLTEQKFILESQVEKLQNTLTMKEDTIKSLAENVKTLRIEVANLEDENKLLEKSLHQRELQIAALEQSNENQEKAMSQLEALRDAAQNSTNQAQSSVDKQTVQITELKSRLADCEIRGKKSDEILRKFQQHRMEMKTKINRYLQVLKKQEESILVKEKDISTLNCKISDALMNEKKMEEEKEQMQKNVIELKAKLEESQKMIESNQQVITWLNREVNESQLGRGKVNPYTSKISNRLGKSITPFANRTNTIPIGSVGKVNSYIHSSNQTQFQSSMVTPNIKAFPHTTGINQGQKSHPHPSYPSSVTQSETTMGGIKIVDLKPM